MPHDNFETAGLLGLGLAPGSLLAGPARARARERERERERERISFLEEKVRKVRKVREPDCRIRV